jgi:hypothetical protein
MLNYCGNGNGIVCMHGQILILIKCTIGTGETVSSKQ